MSRAAPAAPGHVPVLLKEAMEALDPRARRRSMSMARSAAEAMRARFSTVGARVIALDRDPSAIRAGETLKASSGGRA